MFPLFFYGKLWRQCLSFGMLFIVFLWRCSLQFSFLHVFWQYVVFLFIIYSCKLSVSHSFPAQCVHFSLIFFCVGFYNWLILIVLCSFDSEQFPEIKLLFPNSVGCSHAAGTHLVESRRRQISSRQKKTIHPNHSFSSILDHFTDFPFMPKKCYHFYSNEGHGTAAQHYHLPIDDYANSYTAHRGNKRNREERGKAVITESKKSLRGIALAFLLTRVFLSVHIQMRFWTSIWSGYELLRGAGTCFYTSFFFFLFLHSPYFVQMGLHGAGH